MLTILYECPGEDCTVCSGTLRDSRGLHNIHSGI